MDQPTAIMTRALERTLGETDALVWARAEALKQVPEGHRFTGKYRRVDRGAVKDPEDGLMQPLWELNLVAYQFEIEEGEL